MFAIARLLIDCNHIGSLTGLAFESVVNPLLIIGVGTKFGIKNGDEDIRAVVELRIFA